LAFSVRAADARPQLDRQPWCEVAGDQFSLKPTDAYLQYRATFTSDNGDRYPILDRVEIRLE
jgi:hypothetical protein